MKGKSTMIRRGIGLIAVLFLSGCASTSPYSGLASAVAAINPAYADAASKIERALAKAQPSVQVGQAEIEAAMRAAGYVPVEKYYFRDTECKPSDFRRDVAWTKTQTGAEVFSPGVAAPSNSVPTLPSASVDLNALAEELAESLSALDKKEAK